MLRHLEALLLVADAEVTYLVSGNGDVIEPDEQLAAIGSGGPFAKAAAIALMEKPISPRARLPKNPWPSRQNLYLHQRQRRLRGAGLMVIYLPAQAAEDCAAARRTDAAGNRPRAG
jgi:hypothetical protein